MGGKKGNRTKGNTRPSSSGHTAELLSASGVTGFVGFSGLSTDVAGFITSSATDDVETTVDSDFRMVMKKTTKRDAITKIKALQEFAELCQIKDESAVKGALPYWPRLFVKLSVDHDRRVREAAHQANKQIVNKVKKDLAPYLKSMMGSWVISMCDPFPVAASAAQSAFQMAFPLLKQPEAFEFCKDEIFNYISDILFTQTAKTLNDVETSTPEEIESKYERLLASSLYGLKLYITTVRDLNNDKTVQLLSNILDENKFWKYANYKEIQVRIAWYIFVSSLCQFTPQMAAKYTSKLAPLTLGRLDEAHVIVAPIIWEAMLHLLVTVNDAWQYVNVQKAVFPHLWKFLREGGRGNARNIGRNLLPFLSKIPENAYGEKVTFYSEFFSNFTRGILNGKVKSICTELLSIIQAFFECLRYVLFQNLGQSEEECKIRQYLIQEHLFPIVELAILDPNCNMQKILFSELGCFLRSIECQMNSEVITSHTESMNDILHHFWTNLFALNEKVFSAEDEDAAQIILNRFAQFFNYLYAKDKKSVVQQKVSFSKDSKPESSNRTNPDPVEITQQQMSNNVLVKNTHKLCSSILLKIMSNPKVGYLNLLSEMVHTVPSKSLFVELIKTFNGDSNPIDFDENKSVTQFLEKVLLPWLSNRSNTFGDNEQVLPSILGMILVACSYLPQEQAFSVLSQQCTSQDYYVLEKLISQIISKESEIPNIYKWLKSEQVGKCMVSLTKQIADESVENVTSNSEVWNLLKICFRSSKDFEPVIGLEYLNEILTILTSVLLKHATNSDLGSTSKIVQFVCELSQSLFLNCLGCYQLTSVEEFLVCLFQLSFEKNLFSTEAQKHIQETWCLGTKQLVKFQGAFIKPGGFFCKATQTIQDKLFKRTCTFNQLAELNIVENNAFCLLETVCDSLSNDDSHLFEKSCSVRALLECIIPPEESISELESKFSSGYPERKLYDLNAPVVQIYGDTKMLIPPLICINKCVLNMLCKLLLNVSQEDSDSVEEDATLSESAKGFIIPNIMSSLLVITFNSVLYIHPEVSNKVEIDGMFSEIKTNLKYLMEYLSAEDLKIIFQKLFKLAQTEGKIFYSVFQTSLSYIVDKHPEVSIWLEENLTVFLSPKSKDLFDYKLAQWLIPCASELMIQDIFTNTSHMLTSGEEEFDLCNSNQHLETLVCCLKCVILNESNRKLLKDVLAYFQELKLQSNKDFLSETRILETDCNKVEFVRILCHLFTAVLDNYPDILELWVWDFMMCSACSWINTLHQSKSSLTKVFENTHLACSVFSLLSVLKSFVMSAQIENIASHLRNEWKELYFPNVYSITLPLFFYLCDQTSKTSKNSWELEQLFYALSNSLYNLPSDDMMVCISETSQKPATPKEILSLIRKLSDLLTSKSHPVQWASHYLLIILMPKLAELSAKEVGLECDDQDERERPPPQPLAKTLTTTGQILDTILAEFCVEDCCQVQSYTDSYTYTLAYLLTWRHVLKVFSYSSSEIRSEYALYLQNSKLMDSLLLNLFRLMPNNPTVTTIYNTEICNPRTCNHSSSVQLQNIAYQVYLNTLLQLPALVRQWWNNQDKRTADYVSKFTTTNASSLISHEEIKSVQDTKIQFNNMFVKARPMAREVVATYTMEEITIELVINLPANHPLGPVTVETGQRIGVGLTQWRHWMLQLTTFLTHQNGSILDGLSLWKRNIDKRFEGVEECMICFYVLHGATCQLPRLTCRTCKKKFHSACLYKWFSTSQNASCPLCRNLF